MYRHKNKLIILNFLLCAVPWTYPNAQEPQQVHASQEEALYVRRIMEFWKDKENSIVKSQIRQFLAQYPQSDFQDTLIVILGDTYWTDHQYADALKAYESIKTPALIQKVFNNRIDSLYQLGRYQDLEDAIHPHLQTIAQVDKSPEEQLWAFYYSQALLQRAKKDKDPLKSQKLYQDSRYYLESLLRTVQRPIAMQSLAEIHEAQGETQKAVDLYLDLSQSHPENEESLLFHAANLQSAINPKQALLTFSQIQQMKGARAADAALNKALLLYETQQFTKLLSEKEEISKVITPSQRPTLDFVAGRSSFALGNYEEALRLMEPLLNQDLDRQSKGISEKAILLTIIASAYHLNDLPKVDDMSRRFESRYPGDAALAKVWYIKALTYKNCDRYAEAQRFLDDILYRFPDGEKIENVYFERSLLLFKQRRWKESRIGFINYIQKFPGSPQYAAAMQYIPNATLQFLEYAGDSEDHDALRDQLAADLELVLETPKVLNAAQKPKYLLKLGKTLYDLKRFQKAKNTLNELLKIYPEDPQLYQAHLLMAMCCHDGFQDGLGFAYHAEKVLALNKNFADRTQLHLNLFNTYMQLAKEIAESEPSHSSSDVQKQASLIDKSAAHLYDVISTAPDQVKKENQLWLANFYYKKVRDSANEYIIESLKDKNLIVIAQRSQAIYEKALGVAQETPPPVLNPDNLYLEQELFKLSNIYGWLHQNDLQQALIESLINQQNANPKWDWKLRSRTLFALACAYQEDGETAEALETFKLLTSTMKASDPYVASASKLQYARMSFDSLDNGKKNLENPEIVSILKNLKDLQIRKALAQEPIHLEAALEYARIRSSLEAPEKRDSNRLFLLIRAKEDFTSKDDLWSKDYHASRLLNPDKEVIYQAYIMLIDAHIARLEANAAEAKGHIEEKDAKNQLALSLYKRLIQGKFAVSKYLVDQAKSGLESQKKEGSQ